MARIYSGKNSFRIKKTDTLVLHVVIARNLIQMSQLIWKVEKKWETTSKLFLIFQI
jgi:hypothetical protein